MNKKLIKTISVACGCTTICGVGIGGVVYSTYSAPAKPIYEGTPLPNDVYDIDKTTGTLKGFKQTFLDHPENYKDCNVMKLPTGITTLKDHAFDEEKIPSNIKILDLRNLTEQTTIEAAAFKNNSYINLLVMPSKIKSVEYYAFEGVKTINKIYWDWHDTNPSAYQHNIFDAENKDSNIAYSLSKEGTIEEFRNFLAKFRNRDGQDIFTNWKIEQYQ